MSTDKVHTPDGTAWQGDGKFYRVGSNGKRKCAPVWTVLWQIADEIRAKSW